MRNNLFLLLLFAAFGMSAQTTTMNRAKVTNAPNAPGDTQIYTRNATTGELGWILKTDLKQDIDEVLTEGNTTTQTLKVGKIGINQPSPAASALLDIASTSAGVLIPRMTTTQKNAISSPASGLLVYDTTLGAFHFWNGTVWAGIGAQNLNQTLTVGNSSTLPISLSNSSFPGISTIYGGNIIRWLNTNLPDTRDVRVVNGEDWFIDFSDGAGGTALMFDTPVPETHATVKIPNQSGTIALVSDIPGSITNTSQLVNDGEGGAPFATTDIVPTTTSGITNDGQDGINPFITAADIPVTSVNTQTGDVVLNQDNIGDGTVNKGFTLTEKTKLAGIANSATNVIIDAVPTNGSANAVSSDGTFDALATKQNTINLTTTGTSGAATLISNVLNIPNYAGTASYLDFVFPEAYGAVGNGTTDDTAAIQSAINTGFPVWFSSKTYKTTTLTLTANTVLQGEGYNTVLYTTSNAAIIDITGNYNSISGIRFKGNSTGGSQNGIQAVGVVGLTSYRIYNKVNNCYGENLGGSFIYSKYMVGTSSGAKHEGSFIGDNCIVTGCTNGIFSDVRGEYNYFTNFSFSNCTKALYVIAGNINVNGARIVDSADGLYMEAGANDAHGIINSVQFNHNTRNFYSNGVANGMIISNCTMYSGAIDILTSDSMYFNNCFFGGTFTITSTNSTNTNFTTCKFASNPTFTTTGAAPRFDSCKFASANNIMNSGGDYIDYSATSTITGWSSYTSKTINVWVNGKTIFVSFDIGGTSNSTTTNFTIPFTNVINSKVKAIYATDNGAVLTNGGAAQCNTNSSTISLFTNLGLTTTFTASGTKRVIGLIELQAAN